MPLPNVQAKYRLVAEQDVLRWSVYTVKFAAFTSAVDKAILTPNFPFLTMEGGHEESFPSTAPFDFVAATYFLPMTALLGTAISSVFIGRLSDRYGRRPFLLACAGLSVLGSIAKYLARDTFWGFCSANFLNGLFGATLPVAMAYISDVHPSRAEKNKEIGFLVGQNMLGITGGGVCAILMQASGLFTPLLLGASLNFVAFCFMLVCLVEPQAGLFEFDEDVSDESNKGPESLYKMLLSNVVVGAFLDGVGSAGLFPLALTPLAFETFYSNFLLNGQTPLMSQTSYKWITMLVALMVIPGAIMTKPVFAKIGAAGGCVFGNLVTAVGICGCILIANQIDPPTQGSFIGFVCWLYLIYPFTVISNLSTGPMLDMLAPRDSKGFVQGLNSTVMNLSRAASPFLLGLLSDEIGTVTCMWTCVGISVLAAFVNVPLMFSKTLKVTKPIDYAHTALQYEDGVLAEKILNGEWVPLKLLTELNEKRYASGLPFLVPPVGSYENDKTNMNELRKHAHEDFQYQQFRQYYYLTLQETDEAKQDVIEHLKKSHPSKAKKDQCAEDMGKWFAAYANDNGYFLKSTDTTLIKQMIIHAFPPINSDNEFRVDNIEDMTLRYAKVINDYFNKSAPSRANEAFRNSVVY